MLRMIGFCIKFIFFSIFILVLGNCLHWNGRTLSDQIKVSMAHAERTEIWGNLQEWASKLTRDARSGFLKKPKNSSSEITETIPHSEKQKLKALIRELNNTRKKD